MDRPGVALGRFFMYSPMLFSPLNFA